MGKIYVVSYIDWFDNDLQSVQLNANNLIHAYYKGADFFGVELEEGFTDVDTIKQFCFDLDCMMNAVEVKIPSRDDDF